MGTGGRPPVSGCGVLCAPWRERLCCTQPAAHAYAPLHLPPAALGLLPGKIGDANTGESSESLAPFYT